MISPVVAFLTALTAGAFGYYIEEKKYMYLVFFVAFIMAVGNPLVLLFLPVYLYDVVYKKVYWLSAVLAVYALPTLIDLDTMQICLFLIITVLSVFLAKRTLYRQFLAEELIRIRDDSTERNLRLKEKNKNLLEKQDYEIYLATLRERNRIAREIHDNVGHLLSRSILQVGAMLTVKKDDESLLLLKESLDAAMQGIRSSVHDLRDDALDLETSTRQILADYSTYRTSFEYDIAPELPGALEVIEKASKLCHVSIAHTSANYDQAVAGFEHGADHITHLFNGMPPMAHRDPGVVGAAQDKASYVEIICDGIHIHPSIIRAAFRLFGDD